MKNSNNISVSALVDKFVSISLAQYEAIEGGEIQKYNQLYSEIDRIVDELKNMRGDQRRMILALYAHRNIFVRLQSASVTKDIAPSAAKRIFEEVEASRITPYAVDAAFALKHWKGEN